MNKKTLVLILSGILVMPKLAFAVVPPMISNIIVSVENTAFYLASAIVVILWIVTGLLFVTAGGAPEKLKTAKTSLIASVAGTVLVILAGSAIALVGSAFGLNTTGGQ